VIYNIFEQLVAQGKTIVMVTHDPGIIERVPRSLVIQDGEVFEVGDEALG
jgi:ABC-type lipoprotein export system ATPase subunit